MRISDTFPQALSKEVEQLIKKAASRAKANKRKTIQPRTYETINRLFDGQFNGNTLIP